MKNITEQVNILVDQIHILRAKQQRTLIAIAGAPGSGKSTIAQEAARILNLQKCPTLVVPMDGFHLDNRILEDRNILPKKGAPQSFDAAGFVYLIRRLKSGVDVIAPCFDRARDISVAGAIDIPADIPVIIVEGNYLMYDAAPWNELPPLWDLTVRLDVPLPELRARLIQRWLNHNLSRAAATRRAESNDIPNAAMITSKALPCDLTF